MTLCTRNKVWRERLRASNAHTQTHESQQKIKVTETDCMTTYRQVDKIQDHCLPEYKFLSLLPFIPELCELCRKKVQQLRSPGKKGDLSTYLKLRKLAKFSFGKCVCVCSF